MLGVVTLHRTTFTAAGVVGAALACWIVALRGMSMMGGLGPFVAVWVTTMAAMMLPSTVPMVVAYTGLGRERSSTTAFVLGYLVVWTAYGLVAYAVAMLLPDWSSSELAGAGLMIAGVYQLTPLKAMCLRHCRTPVGFLTRRWRPGRIGALSLGIEHGAWCAGCCTGLMLALFALGMDNLAWMAAVALLILAEKVLPHGERLVVPTGAALLVAGAAVLV
jgi:predicted metal-binding membrane protein